jgi:hypothetical protein
MHRKEIVTEFLNVDLDIRGHSGDLENFLRSIGRSVVVLNHTDQEASIEMAQESASLEETVMSLVELIGALQPDAKCIWNRLEFRRLNVGIQAAYEPHAACFAISAKTVELLAPLQFEIVFTVYTPLAD